MDIDRLTARNKDGIAYLVNVKPDEQEVDSPHKNTLKCILDCFERLAQYEDEAIARQSVTSEDVDMVIKLMRAYGKNITSKCQIEGTIFYDTGSPCIRHRFGEGTIDTIITALQAYQPNISKTETTSEPCEWCEGDVSQYFDVNWYDFIDGERGNVNYCPNCGRRLED